MKIKWHFYPSGIRLRHTSIMDGIPYKGDGRQKEDDYDKALYPVRMILRRYEAFWQRRKWVQKVMTRDKLALLAERNGFEFENMAASSHVAAFPKFWVKWNPNPDFNMRYDMAFLREVIRYPPRGNPGLVKDVALMVNRADQFRSKRAPWRRITKAHAACVMRDIGGVMDTSSDAALSGVME